MSRLLINLFFIVILCFTLSALPINTEIMDMFDFGSIFETEEPIVEEEPEPVDETFTPVFTLISDIPSDRQYNPNSINFKVTTNITKEYENSFDLTTLELKLFRNDSVYQIFEGQSITSITTSYEGNFIAIDYTINLDKDVIGLDQDGFYEGILTFKDILKELPEINLSLAYRDDITYLSHAKEIQEGNFVYKAYFLSKDENHLVPFYFSVPYPESITVEARDRLYTPPTGLDISPRQPVPTRSSVSKIGNKHYGIFFYTNEFGDTITDAHSANMAVEAIVKTLIRLPHIDKISVFVDEAQVEGSFYDVDLSLTYEEPIQSYVYLTENSSAETKFLIPVPIEDENIYDEVWMIFNALKSGSVGDKQWSQIVPPEVILQNFLIEGTTLTLDFNAEFVTAYDNLPVYKELMLNSILYSFTSINNITKVAFTVDGDPLTEYAGMDFTEPVLAPPFINFIEE